MKNMNLIIGLVVAAALAAGIYYAQTAREAAGEGPPPEVVPAPAEPGDPVVEGQVPDVTLEDGKLVAGGIQVAVAVGARPIKAYEEATFQLYFTDGDGAPVTLGQGMVKFNMSMDMGRHHYALEPDDAAGRYITKATIPMCPSGKVRWYGNLEFSVDGTLHKGGFQFDIEP